MSAWSWWGEVESIYVVEPHADDAYLSLGAFIQANAERVTIVTVFSGTRKRGADAAAYARAVGAKWVGLGLVEGDTGIGGDALIPSIPLTREDLPQDGVVIFPLGIQHPEHKAVAALAVDGDMFYVENPYQLRQKNQGELRALTEGRVLTYMNRPDGRAKYKFHDLFKDQGLFMYRNGPDALESAVEMILR